MTERRLLFVADGVQIASIQTFRASISTHTPVERFRWRGSRPRGGGVARSGGTQFSQRRGQASRRDDAGAEKFPRAVRELLHRDRRAPSVGVAYLYHATDKMPRDALFAQIRRAIERVNTRRLRETIRLFDPDHIVCTHFLPAELLAHEIRRGRAVPPVWVQVTDFDLHRLWVQAGMRGYFAASDEIAFRMAARGIPKNSVHVTGIPIMPVFSQHLDRAVCARELGIAADRTTLLLMTGGAGIAGGETLIERLLGLPDDFQIVALAGKNQQLLANYRGLGAASGPLRHPCAESLALFRTVP